MKCKECKKEKQDMITADGQLSYCDNENCQEFRRELEEYEKYIKNYNG